METTKKNSLARNWFFLIDNMLYYTLVVLVALVVFCWKSLNYNHMIYWGIPAIFVLVGYSFYGMKTQNKWEPPKSFLVRLGIFLTKIFLAFFTVILILRFYGATN